MKKLWYIAIISVVLTSCKKEISEFQSQNFIKYFGSGSTANGYDIQELSDGYIIAGSDNTTLLKKQMNVVRTNKAGNTTWQRQFGGDQDEEGRVVKVVGDIIYVAGTTSGDESGITRSFIIKLNFQGDKIDSLSFGENQSFTINDFFVDESAIYVVGETNQFSSIQTDYFVGKYTLAGQEIKKKPPSAIDGNQSFKKILFNQDGRLTVVGTNSGVIGNTYTHIWVGELNTDLIPIRVENIATQNNHSFGDALFYNNEIIISYNQLVGSAYEARVIKISATDFTNTVWHIQTGLQCQAKALALSADVTIMLCGERNSSIHFYKLNSSGSITLDSQTQELKPLSGFIEALIPTSDNGWALIGTTSADYGTMMQLIKTDAELFLFQN